MNFNSQELSIFASTTVALLAIVDVQGRFMKKNHRWKEEFELSAEEDKSLTVFELLLEKDREALRNTLSQIKEKDGVSHQRFRFIGRNYKIHILDADLQRVGDQIFIRATDSSQQDKEHRSLEQISKLAHTGAWFHNPLTSESYWSKECYRIYGLEKSKKITEQLVLSLFLEKDREQLQKLIKRLYERFEGYTHLGRIKHASGEERWIKTVAKPIEHEGKVIYVNGIAADVTERQNLMEELREQNHLQELALKGIRSGLFYHNLVTNEITYGPEFKRMIGVPQEQERLHEEAFRKLIYAADREPAKQRHLQMLDDPSPYYFNHYRLTHLDGSIKHYEVYAWKELDQKGRALKMVGNLINVDQRVMAQKELKSHARRLEAVVNNGFTHTFLLDLSGNILLTDENSIEFIQQEFGLHPLQKLTHFTEVIPHSFAFSFDREFKKAIKGNTIRKEIERVLNSGASRWLDLMYSPVKDDDTNVSSVLLMFADITERKVAEVTVREARLKAEQLNALKNNILSNISHEIRTPMNGIMGGMSLLEKSIKDDEQKQILEMLQGCGERLFEMLTSLVRLSEARAVQSLTVMQALPLVEVVTAAYERHRHMSEHKGLELCLKLPKPPTQIHANLEMFNVALDQIINNAIKYTNEGSVSINAKLIKAEGMVEIAVKDTGMGIEKDDLTHIFDDFVQASVGMSRRFEGTGIGLSLTKQLIEQMGGSIRVLSSPGNGSTFTLKIPMAI